MKNHISKSFKQISVKNFFKLNKFNIKMESKFKEKESELFFANHKTLTVKNTLNMETNDIKFPTFDDPFIEEQLKKEITLESLLSDIKRFEERLGNFSEAYDSLFNSDNGTITKKEFQAHNLNYSTYKIYSYFLTRQINLIYYLLQKKFIQDVIEKETVFNYIKKNYFDVDAETMIHDYFLNNQKYFMISRENDNPEEYERHLQIIKIIKGLIRVEKDILLFDLENQNFIPSVCSISVSLVILRSVVDYLILQVIELTGSKEIKEDLIIKFFHNCNKLELLTSYFILSYKIPHDDIFNLPENSEEWKKFKNFYERRVIYSRNFLKKKLQQVFDMIILGNASVSKGHNQFDSKYLKILGSGWYMAYFFFNKKQASIQSIKFSINPNFDVAHKIWNMLDSKGIKDLLKLTLPRIKYSKRWYLKKTEEEITFEKIKNLNEQCLNFEAISTTIKNSTNFQEKLDTKSSHEDLDNLILRKIQPIDSNNYVKIRIISHKDFYVPVEKTFLSNFFSCYSIEKNFSRDSLIIHIHGGGFIAMSASSHENYTRKWAEKLQVPIFSIDYRLAPDYPYPNALDDVYQAYMWIVKYTEQTLNMNVKNIILTGDSAGGNLATALTYLLILQNKPLPTALFLTYPGNLDYQLIKILTRLTCHF